MAPSKYITSSGDMWDLIAYKVYGEDRTRPELLMHLLLEANPAHRKTLRFESGVSLLIPEPPENVTTTLPPWLR